MKEIVNQVLREEEQARERIQKAQEEADRMALQARKDAARLLEETAARTKEAGLKKKQEAEKTFLAEKEKILRETREQNLGWRKKREADLDAASKKVLGRIIDIGK